MVNDRDISWPYDLFVKRGDSTGGAQESPVEKVNPGQEILTGLIEKYGLRRQNAIILRALLAADGAPVSIDDLMVAMRDGGRRAPSFDSVKQQVSVLRRGIRGHGLSIDCIKVAKYRLVGP